MEIKYLNHFSKKICQQEFLKISKSGHTTRNHIVRLIIE